MHPWGKFWRLLSVLGADSYFYKAQQNDPEMAAKLAAAKSDDDPPWRPALYDWSLLHELLAINNDRLGQVAALLADLPVAVKQRHKAPTPFPRPATELDRALAARAAEEEEAYMEQMEDFVTAAKERWRRQQAALTEEAG